VKYLDLPRYLLMAQANTAPTAIPYRTDAAVSTGSVAMALVMTGVLLVLLIGVLLYSRKRGWLPTARRPAPQSPGGEIRLLSSRRVSMATTVHAIEYAGRSYLLTESSRSASATLTQLEPASEEGESA